MDLLPADTPITLRPWGGYIELPKGTFRRAAHAPAPCKYLVINPGAELSWQYHLRRGEEWAILSPGLEVCLSASDARGIWAKTLPGDVLWIPPQQRHSCRNVSDRAAVVAEIWVNTDPLPSDETDIVRVQDRYGRQDKPTA